MLKKTVVILFVVVFSLTLFMGCGGQAGTSGTEDIPATQESASAGGESESTEPVTITLTVSDAVPIDGFEAVAEAAKEKLGITVELDVVASAGSEDILKTRLASGDMGDMFINNIGAQMLVLNPEQNMVDLSNEPFAQKLDETYKNSGSVDGVLYAAPYSSSFGGGIMYNKKVYEEMGLEVPKTWDDFLANCQKIKDAGKIAIIGTYKDDWSSQLILLSDYYNVAQLDPEFADNFTHNKAKYATNEAALRSWEKLYASNEYMNEDFLAATVDDACQWLTSGEGVHWPMLTQQLQAIEALYPDEVNDIGFFPMPSDDPNINGITVWPSTSLHIYSQSPNIDACKRFLDFYLSDEGLAIYNSVAKPVGPSHILGAELGDDVYECVKDMVPYFEAGNTEHAMEFSTPVKGPACPQICVAVGSQMNTAAEGAELYDKDCEKQAIQLGLEGW